MREGVVEKRRKKKKGGTALKIRKEGVERGEGGSGKGRGEEDGICKRPKLLVN